MQKEEWKSRYGDIIPKYLRLKDILKKDVSSFLERERIDVVAVQGRVKEFDSFWNKVEIKNVVNPLLDIEDLCGIRVVCFYYSDLERISKIIGEEFEILETSNKRELLEPSQFGYDSIHFIVKIKKDWLGAPGYRDLGDLKAEIQVRTILMHSWAEIEHKLAYKEEADIPPQFRRRFSRLSAMLELAQEQFDILRVDREEYRNELVLRTSENDQFDFSLPLNVDTLQAFLDFNYPDRARALSAVKDLLDEINLAKISFKEMQSSIDFIKERKIVVDSLYSIGGGADKFAQVGILRLTLELANDKFWEIRKEKVGVQSKKIREEILG